MIQELEKFNENIIKLKDECPKAYNVVKSFLNNQFLQSLEDSNDFTPEFRQFLEQQQITDEYVDVIIHTNPRAIFDVFDKENIIISCNVSFLMGELQTEIDPFEFMFKYSLIYKGMPYDNKNMDIFKTRIEAERDAVIKAFYILENKLNG